MKFRPDVCAAAQRIVDEIDRRRGRERHPAEPELWMPIAKIIGEETDRAFLRGLVDGREDDLPALLKTDPALDEAFACARRGEVREAMIHLGRVDQDFAALSDAVTRALQGTAP